jgi:hypothetical protein
MKTYPAFHGDVSQTRQGFTDRQGFTNSSAVHQLVSGSQLLQHLHHLFPSQDQIPDPVIADTIF